MSWSHFTTFKFVRSLYCLHYTTFCLVIGNLEVFEVCTTWLISIRGSHNTRSFTRRNPWCVCSQTNILPRKQRLMTQEMSHQMFFSFFQTDVRKKQAIHVVCKRRKKWLWSFWHLLFVFWCFFGSCSNRLLSSSWLLPSHSPRLLSLAEHCMTPEPINNKTRYLYHTVITQRRPKNPNLVTRVQSAKQSLMTQKGFGTR